MKQGLYDNTPGDCDKRDLPAGPVPTGEGATRADVKRGFKKVEGDSLTPAHPDRNDRRFALPW